MLNWIGVTPADRVEGSRDDKTRCQVVVDKYIEFAKKHGSRTQYKHALEILLPTSTLYDYLEGRVPSPAYTYTKIADITEAEEKERINKEIGQRRTRLGAKLGQVTADVKREVLEDSGLENLYKSIIDWTNDDDTRRLYEEKLLQHAYDTLAVVPASMKTDKRKRVQDLAQGLVILKHPFALAWKIALEWRDVERLEEMDSGLFGEFIELFPDDGLSNVLRGYLESELSPFPRPAASSAGDKNQDDASAAMTAEDRLLLMTEGVEDSPSSILSHRIMGEYYLQLDEYGSAADMAKHAQSQVAVESQISGLSLSDIVDAVNIILATALVQYEAPRHHSEARALFDGILSRKPSNTSALIGLGLILEEQEDYAMAVDFLGQALERSSDPKVKAEAAWCKALKGDLETSFQELEACLLEMKGSERRTKALRAETLYRIGMCVWNGDTSKEARRDRNGAYARFLASLQADMNFAPAYTRLGIYYADYGKDKKRARKCFQKALELSASEVKAAEYLARSFANSKEWDLVEVVSQRVVESGKVKPAPGSRKKAITWPFAALGIVQLNNQDYPKSIVSFQSALRSAPDDYHSWVGLGESYHNSGRYIAATKAFEQAQKLESSPEFDGVEGSWFSKYMLANVQRELGEYDAAITGYRDVMTSRPTEFGVSIALLQTLVEGAWRSIELGFFGRAADNATRALELAKDIAKTRGDAFNLWKAVGDSFTIFSYVQAYTGDLPVAEFRSFLEAGISSEEYDLLADIDGIGKDALESLSLSPDKETAMALLTLCVQAAILAQKRAIHSCSHDFHARAVAWYNLGWTEHRAHTYAIKEPQPVGKKKSLKYLKASVQCFKRAIELEAGNTEFWTSLGIVTTELNPKVSQHSFIRSLYLNDRNARVWTNLGALCLLQNDYQLANEAFTRAQSTDPDYAHAWLGQGLLAANLGEVEEAQTLFSHAFEITDASSIIVKRQYALSTFDHLLSSPASSANVANILQPLFALHQLHYQITTSLPFEHLSSLFSERIGDFASAVRSLETVCSELEADYETSESPTTLARFAQAKTDLSRAHLASHDYTSAVSNAETALSLSADEETENPPASHQKTRVSAHLTIGLAHYHTNSMDDAISNFRAALAQTAGDPDIICLLAQVLWAQAGRDERAVARAQLFDCVEKYPAHFGAITLLGVIALLDDDVETLDAVTADLKSLRVDDALSLTQQEKLTQLLTAIATLHPPEGEPQGSAQLAEATTVIMLSPSLPHGWAQLADVANEANKADGADEAYPAEMALLTALKAVPPRGQLEAEGLCGAFAGTGRVGDAQRGIMVAPWAVAGWEGLRGGG